MIDSKRIRDAIWLSAGTDAPVVIGLVLYECEFGGFKGYVGAVPKMSAKGTRADAQYVTDRGGRIPDAMAARLWPNVEKWHDSR